MDYIKVYVAVTILVDEQGAVRPLTVFYGGKEYAVDKVVDVRRTPPEHVGALISRRYDCIICGKVRSLFVEEGGRWFVEAAR